MADASVLEEEASTQLQSGRNARWKAAFHIVRAIGNRRKLDDLNSHAFVAHSPRIRPVCAVCPGDEREDDFYVRCHHCAAVVHRSCAETVASFCQAQKPKFAVRKQHSAASADDYEDEEPPPPLPPPPPSSNPTVRVDPIYLALKEANRMATNRRLSLASSSPSPVAVNTPSPRDSTPSDSMKELTTSRFNWFKLPGSNNSASSSGYASSSTTKSLRNSPASVQSVCSTPSLFAQKSTESQDGGEFGRRPAAAKPIAAQRRPPKLETKMKSLSLDCQDSKARSKGAPTANGYSPAGRRVLRVRPCKTNSFETNLDGGEATSVSCSSCSSPYRGSLSTLPSSSYAVTHDHRAKFAEEIDLSMGQRVLVLDVGDADWWQGRNAAGRVGIFPSTCVARIHSDERVAQVVQNLNLWDGNKSLRLYRDQIVFAQQTEPEPDNLVEVRTEHGHRVNCPLQYLMSLE